MAYVYTRTISAKQPQCYKLTPKLRHTLAVAVTNNKNRAQKSYSVFQEVRTGLWHNKFKGQSSSEFSGNTGYRGRKATGGRQKSAGDSKTGGPEGHEEKKAETLSLAFKKKSENPCHCTATLTSLYLTL